MEKIKIEKLNFKYPGSDEAALCDIDLSVKTGEFILVCGSSGGGKTTLLRLLKPTYAPCGVQSGKILLDGKPVGELSAREEAEAVGYIGQNPENGIVCDKVLGELAFGLENLGCKNAEIKIRVAELAEFFGLNDKLHRKTSELSGGEKQLLNLASVMISNPSLLVADEPTSRLDPVAAHNFLAAISKINKELGVTVIMSEHRTEEAFALADRVVFIENGKIVSNSPPEKASPDLLPFLPTPMRVYYKAGEIGPAPVTVCEGRAWLSEKNFVPHTFEEEKTETGDTAVMLDEVCFSYEKNSPDILKALSLTVRKNEIYAILGGNGAGKSTLLSVVSGINRPYSGKIRINGKTAMLPQNPETLFLHKTVGEELAHCNVPEDLINLCELSAKLQIHPFDLSGGEKQRLALAMVLSQKPDILVLDEPTKGCDEHFKRKLAYVLKTLKNNGMTIILVSHDIEFCAKYAERCALLFDGDIAATDTPRRFFAGNSFYTTAASRTAKGILPGAMLDTDIIKALGGDASEDDFQKIENVRINFPEEKPKKTSSKPGAGALFSALFAFFQFFLIGKYGEIADYALRGISVILAGLACVSFIPQREFEIAKIRRKHSSRASVPAFLASLFTVFAGGILFGKRKYYFISLCVIFETVAFLLAFEKRRPKPRELTAVGALCAIAVCGRLAFAPLPQFKPTLSVVIISGLCFGSETGFLIGAISGFVSNFFFGQGPWTPYQMLALGFAGLLSGAIFRRARVTRLTLSVFGFFAAFAYGAIVNVATALIMYQTPTAAEFAAAFASGLPFDVIHAISTVFFLRVAGESLCEKLERIKSKYGFFDVI